MTLMACPDAQDVMEQEQQFFSALQSVHLFELSESQLSLKTIDGTELIFSGQ
jgi:heat shock protein HslJ